MSTAEIDEQGIEEMFHDKEGPIGKIVEKFCYDVETIAKVSVLAPGSGHTYGPGDVYFRRGGKVLHWHRENFHQASAPGEPPSSDTGRLLTAIGHELVDGEVVSGKVTANVKYAKWLEEGTRFMEPRPFLYPALESGMKS